MSNLKQEILKLLKSDQFISGQEMADRLDVSRTAIWKNINALKTEGYSIESVTRKGYHLREHPRYISPTALEVLVQDSALFSHMEYFETTESTQIEAFQKLESRDGAYIVVALEQTKGRGRFNREWFSPKNRGLYLSIVLRPNIPITEIIRFNLFISLALSKTLDQAFGVKSGIKWPNDIYISNRKVSGFLTEVVSESNVINAIICGIGINIFKDEGVSALGTATDIESEMEPGRKVDLDDFMKKLIHNMEVYYDRFINEPFSSIRDEWKSRAIVFNKDLRITETGESYMAKALDIDSDGFLEVLDETGEIRRVVSADIEL
ncbi:biotin--[acetyl-CoA-carboxylase] ligase [Salinicoccus cyprini]|uniref:Bifunctional ligase/repressor BirA n=1 Tax=Salinicoccus cyprini TaxID=2493691 RepID=A0A558AZ69_9STAP|nr:biotin--[acetyl-CoA-carboxylase] ligase [Salinicoccus cyprini]TVT29553.1 biotin--[acetyl-CoA-carboxylase] ligase [Salinicoccus cyprini]